MYKSYLFLFVSLFMSCSGNYSNNKTIKNHISKIESQIKADSTNGEDFMSFFEQFKKDTLFQEERLCLPFKQGITIDKGDGGMLDSTIVGNNRKEWLFCSFLINDSVNYFHQDIVVKHDTVEVELSQNPSSYDSRKIDAWFVRKKGKWYNYSLWLTR